MSNVVSIGLPKRPNLAQRQAALLQCFALHRRGSDDVFWLKENAEMLNILATSGAQVPASALDPYRAFYDTLEERFRFFPQYYRFLLSICLDLEDLGLEGNKGLLLCDWVRRSDLAACELSDLQRAEAERLLGRRDKARRLDALRDRLLDFICHTPSFALPNKKAAYELTHIVFYLTEYGAHGFEFPDAAITSLEYVGLLAYLDQDIDLLSEVCVALRFAGRQPSDIWEAWLAGELNGFVLAETSAGPVNDSYHEYLVASWWALHSGRPAFPGRPKAASGIDFQRHGTQSGPLRAMSEVMYQLGAARSSDWSQMRAVIERSLPPEQQNILAVAAQSSRQFETFFEGFSRA